jgi:hypothetical protein
LERESMVVNMTFTHMSIHAILYTTCYSCLP